MKKIIKWFLKQWRKHKMPTINRLPVVDELKGGDNFPIYSSDHGDARRSSLTLLLEYMQTNIVQSGGSISQYVDGENVGELNVTVSNEEKSVFLVITADGDLTGLGILLPQLGSSVDSQEVELHTLINCGSIVFVATGSTVIDGTISSPDSDVGTFVFRYLLETNTWYRTK